MKEAEKERLKSTYAENAPRLGSLGTPFITSDGTNIKTPIINELGRTPLFNETETINTEKTV